MRYAGPYEEFIRTRVAVFAAFLCVGLALWMGVARLGSLPAAWQMLRAPAREPLFVDSVMLTDAAEAVRAGQDPYTVTRFDPLHRLFNYPPVWLNLRFLGVTERDSAVLGVTLALLTAAAMLILFRARSWPGMVVSFFAVSCWPVLFAFERGNCDQVVFFLLVAGFFLIDRFRLRWSWGAGLVGLLAVLKIYPVVAAAALVKGRYGPWRAFSGGLFAAGLLVLTCGSRLGQIVVNTPQDTWLSYGAMPLLAALGVRGDSAALKLLPSIAALVVGLAAAWAGFMYRERMEAVLPRFDLETFRGCVAVAGIAIFCFTFARGSSYCYRLMFLVGVLALLVEDLERRKSLRSLLPAVGLLGLLWITPNHAVLYGLYVGGVFVACCAWLGSGLVMELEPLGDRRLRQLMASRVGA